MGHRRHTSLIPTISTISHRQTPQASAPLFLDQFSIGRGWDAMPDTYGPRPPQHVTGHGQQTSTPHAAVFIPLAQCPAESLEVGVVDRSNAVKQPDDILWRLFRTRNKRPTHEERAALSEKTGLQTEIIRTWCAPLDPDACGELDWVLLHFPRD